MQKKSEKTEYLVSVKIENKKLSSEEYEKKIIELAKEGFTSEKIGEKLRKEGIYPSEYGKKISKILKEKELYSNPDIKNVQQKLESLEKHYQKNKQDKKALKEREKIFGNYRKLKVYLERN